MSTPVVMPGCLLEARDIVKSFGQTPALRGASVAVGQPSSPSYFAFQSSPSSRVAIAAHSEPHRFTRSALGAASWRHFGRVVLLTQYEIHRALAPSRF